MVAPSTPPRAATGNGAPSAMRLHRMGPRHMASGWLKVGKAGERKASLAPAQRARRRSAPLWAELVMNQERRRIVPGQRPPRRWTPARRAAASLTSPATTRTRRRARQIRAMSRPNAPRVGSSSWRRTTPARPIGRRATDFRGSGRRIVSVNNQSGGSLDPGRCDACAHASRRLSIVRRTLVC